MDDKKRLTDIRDQIDTLDLQIQDLITQRANLAVEVGKIKRQTMNDHSFYQPDREAQILQNMLARNKGPLTDEQMILIFKNILTACLSVQHSIRVAVLGPEGTFSQNAAIKYFGIGTSLHLSATIDDVFHAVSEQLADFGVVPIENSTTGIINPILDILRTSSLSICDEVLLPIHHCLLSTHTTLQEIQRVYAHEQSFLQCSQWLARYLSNVNCLSVSSNGEAARLAKTEKNSAAIAGELASEQYGLQIVEKNIENNANNATRFLILGRQKLRGTSLDI